MIKKTGIGLIVAVTMYFLLMIPGCETGIHTIASEAPFEWNQDIYWNQLEEKFSEARRLDQQELQAKINTHIEKAKLLIEVLTAEALSPDDSGFFELQANFFEIAPLIAANPDSIQWFIDHYNTSRNLVKHHSQRWDLNSTHARNTVYSMLYGMRAAVEEVLLQLESIGDFGAMVVNRDSSQTPSVELLGMKLHSGDLLVSRGGAEVSALISRGNDYPGNFSHVALLYVDSSDHQAYVIEAHIEKGVAITDLEGYMRDKKLRVMVLRLRPDLPAVLREPLIAHEAAKYMYNASQSRHIPYDFKMDFFDPHAMFCSEVGSYAYKQKGINLWQSESTISSQGIVNWMNSFGVENFVTQLPSDLEYDPQLMVIGEWRDQETLFQDHLDNAVVDVLLERANQGEKVEFNPFQLPLARLLKAYCVMLNTFGKVGMIPEGMSASTALRNNAFVNKFQNIKSKTLPKIQEFEESNNYLPPYWKLVELAKESSMELVNEK